MTGLKPSALAFVGAEAFVAVNVPLALHNGWAWYATGWCVVLFAFWKLYRSME